MDHIWLEFESISMLITDCVYGNLSLFCFIGGESMEVHISPV